MLEEESQKWCLKSLKLNLAQKMQKCEAKTNVSLKGLRGGGKCDTYRLLDKSSPV